MCMLANNIFHKHITWQRNFRYQSVINIFSVSSTTMNMGLTITAPCLSFRNVGQSHFSANHWIALQCLVRDTDATYQIQSSTLHTFLPRNFNTLPSWTYFICSFFFLFFFLCFHSDWDSKKKTTNELWPESRTRMYVCPFYCQW